MAILQVIILSLTRPSRWTLLHGVESSLVMMMTQTSIYTTIDQEPGLQPSASFSALKPLEALDGQLRVQDVSA